MMAKKSNDFSKEELEQLAESSAARELLALLQGNDPEALSTAMRKAAKGDYAGAITSLEKVMSGKEARALLEKLGGKSDG